jgi:hypothetical protein
MRAFISFMLALILGSITISTSACVKNLGEPYSLWNDANEHMKSYAVFKVADPEFARTQYESAFALVETLLEKYPDSTIVKQLKSKERKIHLWTLEEFTNLP